jgi:DNA-binding CsgD family transcriptional regulator
MDTSRLTKEIFERLGIVHPSVEQVNLMKAVFGCLSTQAEVRTHTRLSARERTCLYLLAQGNSLEKIAESMGIKRTTVATFIKRIKLKLGCDTLAQAVYEGMTQHEIPKHKDVSGLGR